MAPQEPTSFSLAQLRASAVSLILWREPLNSALVFTVGLLCFFLNGILEYASITLIAYAALIQIIARIVYTNARTALAEINILEKRAVLSAPDTFVTEEDLAQLVPAVTSAINRTLRTAFGVLVGECDFFAGKVNVGVIKVAGVLYAVSLLGRLFGTTGVFFLAFLAAFTGPKVYERKQREIDNGYALLKSKVSDAALVVERQLRGLLAKVKKS